MKDWIEFGLNELTKQILKQESELSATAAPQPVASAATGWRARLREYNDQLEVSCSVTPRDLTAKENILEVSKEAKAYLLEVQDTLLRYNAKTWREIHPPTEPEPEQPKAQAQSETPVPHSFPNPEQEWVYVYLSKDGFYCEESVPQHLTAAYDELYEACYSGSNEKIQQLCLSDSKLNDPLNISVRYGTSAKYQNWGNSSFVIDAIWTEAFCPRLYSAFGSCGRSTMVDREVDSRSCGCAIRTRGKRRKN